MPLIVSQNPLASYYLTILRDKRTPPKAFREYLRKLGYVLAIEASKLLEREETLVETPIDISKGIKPRDRIAIVPILRAGLPMAEGVLELIDRASLGIIVARRIEEEEIRAKIYYEKIPEADYTIVVDPMIATGSTLIETLKRIRSKIIVIAAIGAPEGVNRILEEFPEATIIVASIDRGLNDRAFIVPGLGDAGDRAFGTI